MDSTRAISQFGAARTDFAAASRGLGPEWVSGTLTLIPWVGRQYAATRSLAHIGFDGSTAGLELARALHDSPAATSSADAPTEPGSQLASRLTHVDAALTALSAAIERADTLSPDGLVPPLANQVRTIRSALHDAAPLVRRARALFQLDASLVSQNSRILIVSQDGAELRPTGGWAGSFGIVTIGPTGAHLDSYQDVFVLPDPPGRVTPPPGAFQTHDFNFRNANWWLDFPTSAQAMLAFWRAYGQPPVDGLIVIDTVVMQDLLEVVGPITTPRHNETFTSSNLLERLLYLTQFERGGQPDRKNVLVELAQELEKRILNASPNELAKSALAVAKAADAKHVQMYFTDPNAEAAVDALGWSGRVAPPSGTTDVVAISNAMNKPGKVNVAMKKSIDYNVRLQSDRSAETTLVLGYANTGPYLKYLPPDFRDWLRVYRAPGTSFPSATPSGGQTMVTTEFGFPAEVRGFTVGRGQKRTESLTARVPQALTSEGPGNQQGDVWYRLYMVRQADLQDIPLTVSVTAPQGWRLVGAAARLTASGTSLPVTIDGGSARMAVPLSGDLALEVRLAR